MQAMLRQVLLLVVLLCLFFLYIYLYMPNLGWTTKREHAHMSGQVTVVTAYLNIGSFKKGSNGKVVKPDKYHEWIKVFRKIKNPVVAFFDNDQDVNAFNSLRSGLPKNMTEVIKISRNDTWAFSLLPRIARLFSQASYPKHNPNTVIPEYACTMHAKYEFVQAAVRENTFGTQYFAWVDIGLYREYKSQKPVTLHLPPAFNASRVAYSQVYGFRTTALTARMIVMDNMVWVAGGFFIGRHDVLERWTRQYRVFTEKMLKTNWISTDEQVLYYMFQPEHNGIAAMDVRIQTYKTGFGGGNKWFHLGNECII